jgi:arylsulfatase A
MRRREFLRDLTLGGMALTLPNWLEGCAASPAGMPRGAAIAGAGPAKPNIICILGDDVGLGNIGCCGADKFPTPRIDALAAGGIRFERCYSTPLCGPSRCQLLTGQYPFRTGLISNQSADAIAPDKQVMIPTIMKKAGYVTASVGKWGQMCLGPGEWGFDEYLVFPGSGKYWASQRWGAGAARGAWDLPGRPGDASSPRGVYRVNGKVKELADDAYLPDVMHDFLMGFIRRHRDQPFFAYYPVSHIHAPILRTPDSKPDGDFYADNIAYMDKLVGKLVDGLERLGLREKTLVIFTGDNGTAGFAADRSTVHGKRLWGQKGTMLEGGSRVPLVANWPGVVPAGVVLEDLTDFSDFFPTFAELGGADLPQDRTIDGRSFAGQLRGRAGQRRPWSYVELSGKRYVCDERWKLTGTGALFDLKDAPFHETLVPVNTGGPEAGAARQRLHEVLVGLVGAQTLAGPALPAAVKKPRRARNWNNRGATQPAQ